ARRDRGHAVARAALHDQGVPDVRRGRRPRPPGAGAGAAARGRDRRGPAALGRRRTPPRRAPARRREDAAMIVEQQGWGHIRVTGDDRVRFLQGLTTANVEKLDKGGHTWGAILSPKGRVLSVIEVVREHDCVWLHCEPVLTDKTIAILEKHAMLDEVL